MKKFNLKERVSKIDVSEALLTFGGLLVTVVGTMINNANDAKKQAKFKEEIKKELTEELLNGKN